MGFDEHLLPRLFRNWIVLGGIVSLGLLFLPGVTLTQENTVILEDHKSLLAYAEDRYGGDDLLMNGQIYVPLHSLASGHPYFEVHDWIFSTLYVSGRRFDQVQLKYDIELDDFVLFIRDKQDRKNYLLLNRHYVDSVVMGKYSFVNASLIREAPDGFGYVEEVYDREFYFFIHHRKEFKKEYSESKPYGEYSEQISTPYLLKDGRLFKMNSKKDFLSYFEPHKRKLKSYLRKNKIKYKKANSGQLYQLLIYCEQLQKK